MTEEQENFMKKIREGDWYKSRPKVIQEAIDKIPPVILYQFKDSKLECQIIGYSEPHDDYKEVTLIVQKTGRKEGGKAELLIPMLHTNRVFGVSPNDLEPSPVN